jgi:hypothetical protein
MILKKKQNKQKDSHFQTTIKRMKTISNQINHQNENKTSFEIKLKNEMNENEFNQMIMKRKLLMSHFV